MLVAGLTLDWQLSASNRRAGYQCHSHAWQTTGRLAV